MKQGFLRITMMDITPILELQPNGKLRITLPYEGTDRKQIIDGYIDSDEGNIHTLPLRGGDFTNHLSLAELALTFFSKYGFPIMIDIGVGWDFFKDGNCSVGIHAIIVESSIAKVQGGIYTKPAILLERCSPIELLTNIQEFGDQEFFEASTLDWQDKYFRGDLIFEASIPLEITFAECFSLVKEKTKSFFDSALTKISPIPSDTIYFEADKGSNMIVISNPFIDDRNIAEGELEKNEKGFFEIERENLFSKFLLNLSGQNYFTSVVEEIVLHFDEWKPEKDALPDFLCMGMHMVDGEVKAHIMLTISGMIIFGNLHPNKIIQFFKEAQSGEIPSLENETHVSNLSVSASSDDELDSFIYFYVSVPIDLPLQQILDQEVGLRIVKFFGWIENYYSQIPSEVEKIIIRINKEIRTAFKQYLTFFNDFVESSKNENFEFEVINHPSGLELQFPKDQSEDVKFYLSEYLSFIRQNLDEVSISFSGQSTIRKMKLVELQLKAELRTLQTRLDFANYKIEFLEDQLKETKVLLSWSKDVVNRPTNITFSPPQLSKETNTTDLLNQLLSKAINLTGRRYSHSLEDLHNDLFTDWLRDKGYRVADQTRNGRSKIGAGELDIAIREEGGSIVSIVEAFRLASCGANNKIVSEHIDKLIHDYDTAGNECNFILVYSEAKSFRRLWKNYVKYVKDLNNKTGFRNQYSLVGFKDTKISTKTNVKVGLAEHLREEEIVEVYHIFIDMNNER